MVNRLLSLLLLVAALAGCATQSGVSLPTLDDWETRQKVLAGLDNWGFSGRIAVRDAVDGFQGSLHWEQRRDYFDARVSGPLGMGAVRIAGDVGAVRVTDKDGVETRLHDPEADLQRRFGWQIPIESLRYWALGIPDTAYPAELQFADDGTLQALDQAGWQVLIDRYRAAGETIMPRRLTASRDSARVTLVIDRWTFR
ncbi:MAG: outer membrane lipoprotein LolB [Woeseia sp.]|nr:lipoprotein insertase outer membrane protein LolB [Woeseia sp.]NNE60782.1 outer membrane lipoprotein LolB [Woeseia sp.]